MRVLGRRLAATSLLLSAAMVSACSDDDPTGSDKPPQILGVQATATGPTSVRVTFNSRSGDNSFVIERAPGGASATFSPAGTAQAPATPGAVNFDDTGLAANTDYQYRVIAVRGSQQSDPSTSVAVKTQVLPGQTIEVTQDITTSTTWTKNNTYLLKGFIHVANGATLTIEAGTKIQGDFNTLGSSLFILRGAKIIAIGTAAEPIVFTSSQPAGQRKPGDWGGLIIIGNARISRTGVEIDARGHGNRQHRSRRAERTIASPTAAVTTDTDNSGELRYVRVEFAGYAPSLNDELNSFTFAAVGSGTKLSYLQALAGLDDSFELFGGAVDARSPRVVRRGRRPLRHVGGLPRSPAVPDRACRRARMVRRHRALAPGLRRPIRRASRTTAATAPAARTAGTRRRSRLRSSPTSRSSERAMSPRPRRTAASA